MKRTWCRLWFINCLRFLAGMKRWRQRGFISWSGKGSGLFALIRNLTWFDFVIFKSYRFHSQLQSLIRNSPLLIKLSPSSRVASFLRSRLHPFLCLRNFAAQKSESAEAALTETGKFLSSDLAFYQLTWFSIDAALAIAWNSQKKTLCFLAQKVKI